MKKILFVFILIGHQILLCAQSGPHNPSGMVTAAYISENQARLLTLSATDITLWNFAQNKMIWTKKTTDFGSFKSFYNRNYISIDNDLNYLIIENADGITPRRTFIDLNTQNFVKWGWLEYKFASNGMLPVRDYSKEKNQNYFYLINPKTLQKELIAQNLNDIELILDNNVVKITSLGNDNNTDPKKNRYYGINTKTFADANGLPLSSPTTLPFNSYSIDLNTVQNANKINQETVFCKQNGKKINSFIIANPQIIQGTRPAIVAINHKNNTVFVLEHQTLTGNYDMAISFINTYNYLTGQQLYSLQLSSSSANAIASAKAIIEKSKAAYAEQNRINNLPQNITKQKINSLSFNGLYLVNQKTLRIFKLLPEKDVTANGMAIIETVTSGTNTLVTESIANLENNTLYKSIKSWKVCPYCQGKGITQTYSEKEIDQTLSKGRIITQTTTYTNGCKSCGGGGTIPNKF